MELIRFKTNFGKQLGTDLKGIFIKMPSNRFYKIGQKGEGPTLIPINTTLSNLATSKDYEIIDTKSLSIDTIKENIDMYDPKQVYPEEKRIDINLLQDDEIDVNPEDLKNHYVRAILCLKYFEQLHAALSDSIDPVITIETLINEFIQLKKRYDEQIGGVPEEYPQTVLSSTNTTGNIAL